MGSRCNGLAMCPQEGGPPSLVQLWMMLLHANQPVPVSPELKGVVQRQIYRLIVPDDNVYTYMHVYIYIYIEIWIRACIDILHIYIYIHIYICTYTTHNSRSLVLKWNSPIFPWHPFRFTRTRHDSAASTRWAGAGHSSTTGLGLVIFYGC